MSANTKIEWADHTFNPWIGCTKVSPGCDNCYAKADFDDRKHRVIWGPGQARSRTKTWGDPVKWNAQQFVQCAQCGYRCELRDFHAVDGPADFTMCPVCSCHDYHGARARVFCASLADVFDNEVPGQWRIGLVSLILATPRLDWLLLTKRVGNAADMLEVAFRAVHAGREGWRDNVPPNVWIGATIVNQDEADRDIPKLLAVPARVHFISNEPALDGLWIPNYLRPSCTRHPGALDADGKCEVCEGRGLWGIGEQLAEHEKAPTRKGLDWVICGGESGPGARPMHPDWARSLRDQCEAAGVPFLFKQWGEWVDADNGPEDDAPYEGKADCWAHIEGGHHDGAMGVDFFNTYPMYRVGKKTAGRLLDGRTWDQVPS